MAKMAEIEVWVVVDEDGNYAAGVTEDDSATKYRDEVGEPDGSCGYRRVKLTVTVPLPEVIEVAVTVPDTEGVPTATIG